MTIWRLSNPRRRCLPTGQQRRWLVAAILLGTFGGTLLQSYGLQHAPAGICTVLNATYPLWLIPIMFVLEILSMFIKPFALCIRLFANMTAGHTVILSLVGLIFVFGNLTLGKWGVAAGSVGMSLAMMLLEIFVAFLQAYIFAMLTSVFVGLIRHAH